MGYAEKFCGNLHILVRTKNEEHEEPLRLVLQELKDNQLNAKLSNCTFLVNEVSFHGQDISNEGHRGPEEGKASL